MCWHSENLSVGVDHDFRAPDSHSGGPRRTGGSCPRCSSRRHRTSYCGGHGRSTCRKEMPGTPSARGWGATPDTNEAASAFTVTSAQVNQRVFSRPGEALQIHGSDRFSAQRRRQSQSMVSAFFPLGSRNRTAHFHGRHADEHVILRAWPGLCGRQYVDFGTHQLADSRKGLDFADSGDFASAGSVHINLIDSVDQPTVKATLWSFDASGAIWASVLFKWGMETFLRRRGRRL